MFFPLAFLFTVIPALELYTLFKVGAQIGALNTISIIVITGMVGAYLAKSQGLKILQKIQGELSQQKIPTDEIISGFLIFGGGLLLMTPGFFTDALGLCMVMPVTRHLLIIVVKAKLKNAIAKGTVQFSSFQFGNGKGFQGHFYSSSNFESPFKNEINKVEDQQIIEAEFTKKN